MSNMEILLPFVSPILLAHLAEACIAETVLADALLNQRQLLVNLRQAFFQLLIISIISADCNNLGILLLRNIAQLPGTAVAQIINQLRVLNRNSLGTDARQHICYGLYCFMRYRYINFYPLHFLHSFIIYIHFIIQQKSLAFQHAILSLQLEKIYFNFSLHLL